MSRILSLGPQARRGPVKIPVIGYRFLQAGRMCPLYVTGEAASGGYPPRR